MKDAKAEIACVTGDAKTLSKYLRQQRTPLPDVVRNIAACLLANRPESGPGPGGWKLKFSPRNGRQTGRPRKHRPKILNAVLAIAQGEEIPLGYYLCATPSLDADTRVALAAALDPGPAASTKWQLKYAHVRRGFPRTSLHTELWGAWLGSEALSRHEKEGKLWKQVHYEMDTELKSVDEHASPTLIKKSVAKVREARALQKTIKKTLD